MAYIIGVVILLHKRIETVVYRAEECSKYIKKEGERASIEWKANYLGPIHVHNNASHLESLFLFTLFICLVSFENKQDVTKVFAFFECLSIFLGINSTQQRQKQQQQHQQHPINSKVTQTCIYFMFNVCTYTCVCERISFTLRSNTFDSDPFQFDFSSSNWNETGAN